jgi:putative FmdB family regulatory protein
MPIYEYQCRKCQHEFEAIVRVGGTAACPSCQSDDVERVLSMFAVNTADRAASSLAGARKRYQSQTRDQRVAEREDVMEHINEREQEGKG